MHTNTAAETMLDELIDMATICCVTPHEIAGASNYMLSRRHVSRSMTNRKPPSSPLQRLVLADILMALKWAYATSTLPLHTDFGLSNGENGGRHRKLVATVDAIKEALIHVQQINSGVGS